MARKRCFEALEDRRLLADVAAPSVSTQVPAVADSSSATASSYAQSDGDATDSYVASAPGAAPQNAAASGETGTTNMANGSGAATSAEAPNEYASPNGSTAPATNATAEYASPNSYSEYPAGYYSNTSSNSYYYTPAQTAAIQSVVASLGQLTQAAQARTPPEQLALVSAVAPGAAVAAAAGSAAMAGASKWSPSDLVVRSDSQLPLAVSRPSPAAADQVEELADPITLLAPSGELSFAAREAAMEPPLAEETPTFPAPPLAGLLLGPNAAGLSLIERGVDELFERLDRLGSELAETVTPRQFAHALMVGAGAAAACEYARIRLREGEAGRIPKDWRATRELQLPRRWMRRRRGNP